MLKILTKKNKRGQSLFFKCFFIITIFCNNIFNEIICNSYLSEWVAYFLMILPSESSSEFFLLLESNEEYHQ